ncbi:serine/threonine-protein kinase RUNKEL [Cannabis sativa]|uniref:serine/threonine-protein kinase RUNKEL n=1 Tax=Cannabis sativa TaxID=3483 RepID=UPI0029C9FCF5|nr:serine/threonine-protein kinase RUNKEL [Cannabis sativa]
MNHYHVYEAIGHGKCSTVYKGRKKKTIEYYAIKSVDKSQKNKVLQEVRILHSLDHQNVLKFYSWYETSAHLWLVLEYCVGGDLRALLQQDGQLPENSIHDFAHDLVKALQYLHSKGTIYCDLKPSNILMDENGRTKLCDFGLARRLNEISKVPSSSLPQAKRGTPSYMAPELFEDGGVHSYASDFWALGCVLYECYTGRPPFVGREFTQLVKSILSDPTPPLPGSPSRPFVNLINSLLVKDPAERIQWPELCGHAFWRSKLTPVPLPSQPAFDNMIELSEKPSLTERNGDNKPHQNRTPPKSRERNVKGAVKQDENSILASKGSETPVKNTPGSRRIQPKGAGRVLEEKPKINSGAARGVNLLRLSRIAKSNLQRENEKENYRRPMCTTTENDSEVKIENTDMELDFNENTEDDGQDEVDGTDNQACTPEDKLTNENQYQGKVEEIENTQQSDTRHVGDVSTTEEPRTLEHESSQDHIEVAATPLPSYSPQLKNQRIREAAGSVLESDSTKSSDKLSQALWHPSDLSVRPVMPSRKSDKVLEVLPSLPFEALQTSEFVKISKESLDAFNSKIVAILHGNNSIMEKQNVIRYLEMLSSNADAANLLTNGPIMLMLVKMLRLSKVSALRIQLASLIGLLIRHSTFIEDSLANSGILGSLTDGLRDKHEKVRRFSMAALGELLFYISTQNEHTKEKCPLESPSKDNRPSSGWQVPNSLISLVSSILRKGEDDMTQLYALRTIENVFSQGAYWVSRFNSQDVINNLCYIYRAVGKQESVRLTAGSCLVRLVCFSPQSIQSVVEKLSFKDMATALIKGSLREQQIGLNLLNTAMNGSQMFTNGRYLLPLAEDKNLVPGLLSLIEQGSEVLKGKALVFVALLCKNGRRWLPQFFCNARLLSVVDRLAKEKDRYVQQCLEAFINVVASTISGLLDIITGEIQQIMGGRRHGHTGNLSSRATSKNNIQLLPVVLHLLGSSSFKRKVVNPQVLQQLANLIKLAESPFQGRDDFQISLLRILESVSEESPVIVESPDIFIREILPSLAVLYKGNKDGDARFLCLKILFDVMINLLNENFVEHRSKDLELISSKHFLPLYPSLIEDEDPIPMYAQKLLVMLIEFNIIKIPDILHLKTVSQCFEFLLGDLSSANDSNVKLCLALASAPEMESKLLSDLKVARRIGNLLEFVYAKDMEDFLEPTLGLCKAFLLRAVTSRKDFNYTEEAALLGDSTAQAISAVDDQYGIRDIADFGSNVSVLLELCGHHGSNLADIASECLILLLKSAPREATAGLLTNLQKVLVILESWSSSRGSSQLLVQRMLHSLGYACKQYISQAMILSISIPEISKIETILSELKSSGIPALITAASDVAMELQRLPRCI